RSRPDADADGRGPPDSARTRCRLDRATPRRRRHAAAGKLPAVSLAYLVRLAVRGRGLFRVPAAVPMDDAGDCRLAVRRSACRAHRAALLGAGAAQARAAVDPGG